MKITKIKIVLLAAFVAASIGAVSWAIVASQPPSEQPQAQDIAQIEASVEGRTEITYTAKAGMTSLEQLQQEADQVVIEDSEFGKYVDSIEGHKGGTDGKYWSFYVNGKMSDRNLFLAT